MIEKVVKRYKLGDPAQVKDDVAWWLSRPCEERLAAVDELRRQFHGDSERLLRIACVVKRSRR